MLFPNGIVLCSTRRDIFKKKLEEWRRAMEDVAQKYSRKKRNTWGQDYKEKHKLDSKQISNSPC